MLFKQAFSFCYSVCVVTSKLKRFVLLASYVLLILACKDKTPVVDDLFSSNENTRPLLSLRSGLMKELPPGQNIGAIYLQIENSSDKTAVLTYVHSDIAEKIEVHRHIYNDGMMQMRNVPHLSLDPKTTLNFKPGEHHLMIFGLSPVPKAGDNFDVVFEFAGFPAQTLNVVVEKP